MSAVTPPSLRATDPRFWNQIGPFGGWLGACLLDAIVRAADPVWPVRSVQVHYLGRVREGPLDIRVQSVRRQRTLMLWRAELLQDGEVAVQAEAVLAEARSPQSDPRMPVRSQPLPAWPAAEQVPRWHGVDHLARFVEAFDYRPVMGLPVGQVSTTIGASTDATTGGWVRLSEPTDFTAPARLLMLADAWFPAVWSVLPQPAPVTTVSLQLLFHPCGTALTEADPGWIAVRHQADAVGAGWGHERGVLWWPDGTMAAQTQQLTWMDLTQAHRTHRPPVSRTATPSTA